DDAVEPKRNAAVWGRAVFQRVQEESETLPRLFIADSQRCEDLLLHILAVNTYRPRPQFESIHCEVVAVGANRRGIAHEACHVCFIGRGERMMSRRPLAAGKVI